MPSLFPVTINIRGKFGKVDLDIDNLWLCGSVFVNDQLLSAEAVATKLTEAIDNQALPALLQTFNGFFSAVFRYQDKLYCFTDKVRSRPLYYYSSVGTGFYVSDDIDALCAQIPSVTFNTLSAEEFLHTGYVSGSDTLLRELKQLQGAELLILSQNTHQYTCAYYYCFVPENTLSSYHSEDWYQMLQQITQNVITRLIQYANGRQIVVPLSGGYDSRAIALHLKMAGYSNVICFTFGRKNSAEVRLSKRIADELGLRWYFVQYNRSSWKKINNSQSFRQYKYFINGLVSVPNIQVFPAIQQLMADNRVEPDAVIAPGHTSAFFSGADIPAGRSMGEGALAYAVDAIKKRHYQNSRTELSAELTTKLSLGVTQLYHLALSQNVSNANSVAEAWNYRERQSKFIINSNRYYDFFKLDWWMPFWDSDFMSFWQQVPYLLRFNKKLWVQFVEQEMCRYSGQSVPYGTAAVKQYHVVTRLHSWLNYFLEPNNLYAIVPFYRWLFFKLRLSRKSGTVFGYMAETMLLDVQHYLQKLPDKRNDI